MRARLPHGERLSFDRNEWIAVAVLGVVAAGLWGWWLLAG